MARWVLNTAVLSLIRLPNLLIVILVQALVYGEILLPVFYRFRIVPQLDLLRMGILSGVTLCITAGGYIVNDIMDQAIDKINRPERMVIGKHIAVSTAHWLYFIFNLIGFTAALYLAFYVRNVSLIVLYPLAGTGLFAYSLKYKRSLLTGNVLVALYCAAVAGVVWFAEREALGVLANTDRALYEDIIWLLTGYLSLAFFSTLLRELVKDAEDVTGDAALGARTLPVRTGIKGSKIAASLAAAFTGTTLVAVLYCLGDIFYPWAIPVVATLVLALLAYMASLIWRAGDAGDFRRISRLAKWIILIGLLLPLFVHL